MKVEIFGAKAPANKPIDRQIEVSRWLDQIEAIVRPPTDECRLTAARTFCSGEAYAIINCKANKRITCWETFRSILFREFTGYIEFDQAMSALKASKLKAHEDPADLMRRIRVQAIYLEEAYPQEVGIIDHVILSVFLDALPGWLSDMTRYHHKVDDGSFSWAQALRVAQRIWSRESLQPSTTKRDAGDEKVRSSRTKEQPARQTAAIAIEGDQGPRQVYERALMNKASGLDPRLVQQYHQQYAPRGAQPQHGGPPRGAYIPPRSDGARRYYGDITRMYCPPHDSPLHDQSNCRTPQVNCYACGNYGHIRRVCPFFPAGTMGVGSPYVQPSRPNQAGGRVPTGITGNGVARAGVNQGGGYPTWYPGGQSSGRGRVVNDTYQANPGNRNDSWTAPIPVQVSAFETGVQEADAEPVGRSYEDDLRRAYDMPNRLYPESPVTGSSPPSPTEDPTAQGGPRLGV